MTLFVRLILAVSITFLLASCGSKPVAEQPVEPQPVQKVEAPPPPPPPPAPVIEKMDEPAPKIEEPIVVEKPTPGLTAERKIYFDFDKSDIKPEFKATLEEHARYLSANPNMKVVIEGHCDERGTREYNMALGERRAFSVSQMLVLLGVSKSQIREVSFGEERPDVAGHDESAWKWNRRAVFIYPE